VPSPTLSKDKQPHRDRYWLICRNGEPFALLYWDTNVHACAPSTPETDKLLKLDKTDFETQLAFETYPVMTMDDYVESMCGMSEDELREGATLHYGNTLTVDLF